MDASLHLPYVYRSFRMFVNYVNWALDFHTYKNGFIFVAYFTDSCVTHMAECLELVEESNVRADSLNKLFEKPVSWQGLESNREEQLLEIEVLQSMFPKELEVVSSSDSDVDSRNSLQLAVLINPPEKSILIELWVSAEDAENCSIVNAVATNRPEDERPVFNRSDSGNRLHTSLLINHITPVILTVVFPETYPSQDCPLFKLSCLWLSPLQLSLIAQQLDKLHKENRGDQIIYIWANWLQNELFDVLGLQNLIICENLEFPLDEAVAYEDSDPFSRFAEIVSYDFAMMEKEFVMEVQTCMICYNEETGANFVRLVPCLHHYCLDCLTEYCGMHVHDGTIG